ncbi:MAG: uroporphyrinogen-III synthase [Gammaproteobacteria bacterium]
MSAPADSDTLLAGRVIAVPETRQLDVLAGLLERRGARVLRCPLVGIEDSPDTARVLAWLDRLSSLPTDLIVFYTGEGIERLLGFARREDREAAFMAALKRIPKLTRGPKPKRALHRLLLDADYEAAQPTTAGLVDATASIPLPHGRVAVQLYSDGQDRELEQKLRGRGIDVDSVAPYVYASGADDEHVARLIGQLEAGQVDAIAFTSKSQVQRLLALAQERRLEPALRAGFTRTRVAAVGPIVAAELEAAGLRVDAMPEHSYSMKPLVTSLCELLGRAS